MALFSLISTVTSWWAGERAGGAVDIILVEDPSGSVQSTPWHCRLRASRVRETGKRIEVVNILINGSDSGIRMKVGSAGEAFFVERLNGNDDGESRPKDACSPIPSTTAAPTTPENPFILDIGPPATIMSAIGKQSEEDELSKQSPQPLQRVRSLSVGDERLPLISSADERDHSTALESEQCVTPPRRMRSMSDLQGEVPSTASAIQSIDSTAVENQEYTWRWGKLPKQRHSNSDLLHLLQSEEKRLLEASPSRAAASAAAAAAGGLGSIHRRSSSSPLLLSPPRPSGGSEKSDWSSGQWHDRTSSPGLSFPTVSCGSLNSHAMVSVDSCSTLVDADANEEVPVAGGQRVKTEEVIEPVLSLQDIELGDIEGGENWDTEGSDTDDSLASYSLDDGEQKGGQRRFRFRKSLVPSAEELRALRLLLRPGHNDASFELPGAETLHCSIFLWSNSTRLVVTDIEGSVTQGKVTGRTFGSFLGATAVREHVNPAAVEFFHGVKEQGYELLYVSHSGIPAGVSSRDYLLKVLACPLSKKVGCLPLGPVLHNPESLIQAVHVLGGDIFKQAALRGVRRLFPPEQSPFFASFAAQQTAEASAASKKRYLGERASMLRCGVAPGRIFLVADGGIVRSTANATLQATFVEMADPTLLTMRFPMSALSATSGGGGASLSAKGSPGTSSKVSVSGANDDAFLSSNYWGSSYHLQF